MLALFVKVPTTQHPQLGFSMAKALLLEQWKTRKPVKTVLSRETVQRHSCSFWFKVHMNCVTANFVFKFRNFRYHGNDSMSKAN